MEMRLFPDAALRLRAKEVVDFDDDLAALAQQMLQTVTAANGVGLAANQVGVLRRLLIVRPEPEQEPLILVNPRWSAASDEREVELEGCLSLPGLEVPVERIVALTLAAQSLDGRPLALELVGYAARIVQHEVDHLDGILIHDRVVAAERSRVLKELRALLPIWASS